MVFCSKCGRGLSENQSFCPYCGTVPMISNRKWIFLGVGVFVIFGMFFLVFGRNFATGLATINFGGIISDTSFRMVAVVLVLGISAFFVFRRFKKKRERLIWE